MGQDLTKGDAVLVFKGRKVAPGTVGTLAMTSEGQYGTRFMLRLSTGATVWVAGSNCAPAIGFVDAEELADLEIAKWWIEAR